MRKGESSNCAAVQRREAALREMMPDVLKEDRKVGGVEGCMLAQEPSGGRTFVGSNRSTAMQVLLASPSRCGIYFTLTCPGCESLSFLLRRCGTSSC